MAEIQDLEAKCERLDWGGVGPKALVKLLAERPSWREDKLEQAYYRATSPTFRTGGSNFRTLIVQLLEHGLIREKQGETGYRFSLNEAVWQQDLKLFEALNILVYFFHENREHRLRADCNLNTFLRRVVSKLAGTRFGDLHHTITYPIAGTIASKIRDFSKDESLQRFRFTQRDPDQIKVGASRGATHESLQSELFQKAGRRVLHARQRSSVSAPEPAASETNIEPIPSAPPSATMPIPAAPQPYHSASRLVEPQTGSTNDPPMGLPYGCVQIFEPAVFWQPVQNKLQSEMLRAAPFADRQALIVEFHVTASRKQRVVLSLMKNRGRCHFLAFSLCGLVSKDLDVAELLASAEIDPSGAYPTLLKVDGERFIGVVRVLPLTLDSSFYEPISTTGKLADKLEASFWGVDEF